MSEFRSKQPTHLCQLTARGRGAVAVIGIRGPDAVQLVENHFRAVSGRSLVESPLGRIVYGDCVGEDLIVCRTAEQEVEVHCHGGFQSPERIIETLTSTGAQIVDLRQWLADGIRSAIQVEARLSLAEALTQRAANHLLSQLHGSLERKLQAIGSMLSGGEVETACQEMSVLLDWKEFGLHLTRPWQVAIAGAPNVGKSSLINAIVGYERAIVYDMPGTTRDVVSATTALDGWPVRFSDTAGMRQSIEEIEVEGIALASEQLEQADLTLWLLDASELTLDAPQTAAEIATAQAVAVGAVLDDKRLLVVVNKIDLTAPPESLSGDYHAISAATGADIGDLLATVIGKLVPRVPALDEPIPFSERQVAGLEKALKLCRTEQHASARSEAARREIKILLG